MAERTCPRCARKLTVPLRWRDHRSVPRHNCPHGVPCLDVNEPKHCSACRAVLEAVPDILEPSCVFCSTVERKIDCYTPSFARGGCVACGIPGGGIQSGRRSGGHEELASIRAETGDVFAMLRAK